MDATQDLLQTKLILLVMGWLSGLMLIIILIISVCEGFFVQLLVKLIILKMSSFGSDVAASLCLLSSPELLCRESRDNRCSNANRHVIHGYLRQSQKVLIGTFKCMNTEIQCFAVGSRHVIYWSIDLQNWSARICSKLPGPIERLHNPLLVKKKRSTGVKEDDATLLKGSGHLSVVLINVPPAKLSDWLHITGKSLLTLTNLNLKSN